MKQKILNTLWVMGVLALALFCLSACNRNLDMRQSYPFSFEAMPVQKCIAKGETAEIRCSLRREGNFADTRYTIRYFQPDGKGTLKMNDGTVFQPNDRYPLTKEEFGSTTPRSPLTARPLISTSRTTSAKCNN